MEYQTQKKIVSTAFLDETRSYYYGTIHWVYNSLKYSQLLVFNMSQSFLINITMLQESCIYTARYLRYYTNMALKLLAFCSLQNVSDKTLNQSKCSSFCNFLFHVHVFFSKYFHSKKNYG